jgi:hypothetical protein
MHNQPSARLLSALCWAVLKHFIHALLFLQYQPSATCETSSLLLAGKKFDPADLPAEQQPVFSISPDKLLLGPKDTASFLISGISQAAGAQNCSRCIGNWCE